MDFGLTSGFQTLSLRSEFDFGSGASSEFTLFTSLPIELRLKIIDHALPTYRTIQLRADVLVADPDFGLYIIFKISPPITNNPPTSVFGAGSIVAPKGWYLDARALDLLLVNKEIRNHYIENFPRTLPTSGTRFNHGAGLIRYAPQESIDIINFAQFVDNSDFIKATAENWRLQKFFSEVRILHIPLDCSLEECLRMLKCFPSLKLVKGTLWTSFAAVGEGVQAMFRASMRHRMDEIAEELEKWKRERMVSYHVPTFI